MAYISSRLEEASQPKPATIRNELAALKRMLNLACRAGKVREVPPFPTLEVRNVRTGFFEDTEIRAVIGNLPDDIAPVVEFLYLTGWRVSEVLGLTWAQVGWRAKTVRLEPGTTKNDEGREFPFQGYPALEALLSAQHEHTAKAQQETNSIIPWVFHRGGKPIKSFRGAWAKACEKAGLRDRLVHDLRRRFGTWREPASLARWR